jgi:hypothetical protein
MYAYLDAGAGSALIAILASGFVGVGVVWRMAKAKVRPSRWGDQAEGPGSSEAPRPG